RVGWIEWAEAQPRPVKRLNQHGAEISGARTAGSNRPQPEIVGVGVGIGDVQAAGISAKLAEIGAGAYSHAFGVAETAVHQVAVGVLEAGVIDQVIAINRNAADLELFMNSADAVIRHVIGGRSDDLRGWIIDVVVSVHRAGEVVAAVGGIDAGDIILSVNEG